MNIPPKPPADPAILPDQLALRVLTRASEIDAARNAQQTITELRTAALGAGISGRAFDTALAELQEQERVRAATIHQPRSIRRRWVSALGLVLALATGTLAVSQLLSGSTVYYYPPPAAPEAPR